MRNKVLDHDHELQEVANANNHPRDKYYQENYQENT